MKQNNFSLKNEIKNLIKNFEIFYYKNFKLFEDHKQTKHNFKYKIKYKIYLS